MDTLTAEEAQLLLKTLLANKECKCRITSPEGNAILISEENYDNLMITLEMLSTPLFLEKPGD